MPLPLPDPENDPENFFGQPVGPAMAGGAIQGAITGPFAPIAAQETSLAARLILGAKIGFAGGVAGDATSQFIETGYRFDDFSQSQAIFAGAVSSVATIGGEALGRMWANYSFSYKAAAAQERALERQALLQNLYIFRYAIWSISSELGVAQESATLKGLEHAIEFGVQIGESTSNQLYQRGASFNQSHAVLSKH